MTDHTNPEFEQADARADLGPSGVDGLVPDPPASESRSGASRWRDLREWIDAVDDMGELRRVDGAEWQGDIGAITAMLDATEGSPCVLFDHVPGYDPGRRVIVNCNGTPTRQAVTLGIEGEHPSHAELQRFWRRTLASIEPVPPVVVDDGPVFENVVEGPRVDVEAFPAPVWHPQDAGRFIGTASLNIMRDPESDWINVGTYRNQVFGPRELGIYTAPGKHGRLIQERWFAQGERCPIVVVVGSDPLLFMAACAEGIEYGQSELDWAGAVRGEPIEVVTGPVTGLPIPARAEIAFEGWIEPGSSHVEGPYGEWTGYYSIAEGTTPVVTVEAVYHRDQPILMGCPQGKPPHEDNQFLAYLKSAIIEEQVRKAGVPGVRAVWCPPEGGNRLLVVVAIEQRYPGHATQAGLITSQVGGAAYGGRLVVVVDADIDVFDMNDVLWAVMTRCDPQRDLEIIRRAWSGLVDSATDPAVRPFNSRLIIDATRPWEWRESFPDPVFTAEELANARQRWGWILQERG